MFLLLLLTFRLASHPQKLSWSCLAQNQQQYGLCLLMLKHEYPQLARAPCSSTGAVQRHPHERQARPPRPPTAVALAPSRKGDACLPWPAAWKDVAPRREGRRGDPADGTHPLLIGCTSTSCTHSYADTRPCGLASVVIWAEGRLATARPFAAFTWLSQLALRSVSIDCSCRGSTVSQCERSIGRAAR